MYAKLIKEDVKYDYHLTPDEVRCSGVKAESSPTRNQKLGHLLKVLQNVSTTWSYGSSEAYAQLLKSYIDDRTLPIDPSRSKELSTGKNICGKVHSYAHAGTELFVMKYARDPKDNDDIAREWLLVKRFLNPLRVFTPNFMYAYAFMEKQPTGTRHKALYEHIDGVPLTEELKNMTSDDLIGVLMQLCLTLAIAQKACLFTHYDLHIDNLLVSTPATEFRFPYLLDDRYVTIVCRYKLTIIDMGYAFAAGRGLGTPEAEVLGIERIENAGVHKDMWSTGFDIIKIVSFLCHAVRKRRLHFPVLAPMFLKYALGVFPDFMKSKERFYSISYSNPHNNITPQEWWVDLCKLNPAHPGFGPCEIEDDSVFDFTPPEEWIAPVTLQLLGKHYQHLVDTSIPNEVYRRMLGIYANSIKRIWKISLPEPKHPEEDPKSYVDKFGGSTDPSIQMGLLRIVVGAERYDPQLLAEFRKNYRTVSINNTKRHVSVKAYHVPLSLTTDGTN